MEDGKEQIKERIMEIIYKLNKEGLNIQETILNLENQGYSDVYDNFLRFMINQVLHEVVWEHVNEELKLI